MLLGELTRPHSHFQMDPRMRFFRPLLIMLGLLTLPVVSACSQNSPRSEVPSEFLSSCVSFPLPDVPQATGQPLSVLLRPFLASGGEISWETVSETQHIFRLVKDDALTRETQSMALELHSLPNATLAGATLCGPKAVLVSRVQTAAGTLGGVEANLLLNQVLEAAMSMPGSITDEPPRATAVMPSLEEVDPEPTVDAGAMEASQSTTGDDNFVYGSCRVTVGGRLLMNGDCSGKAHPGSVFVTSATDGCTVELTWSGDRATAKLFSYKNVCWADEAKTETLDVDLEVGTLTRNQDSCWVGPGSEICLYSGD